jgi:hypothetical protein
MERKSKGLYRSIRNALSIGSFIVIVGPSVIIFSFNLLLLWNLYFLILGGFCLGVMLIYRVPAWVYHRSSASIKLKWDPEKYLSLFESNCRATYQYLLVAGFASLYRRPMYSIAPVVALIVLCFLSFIIETSNYRANKVRP